MSGETSGFFLPVTAPPSVLLHMQPNIPVPTASIDDDVVNELNEHVKQSVSLIQKSGASALKQKLLIKKIADNLAQPRDMHEVFVALYSGFLSRV